jgi:hypothetical protein
LVRHRGGFNKIRRGPKSVYPLQFYVRTSGEVIGYQLIIGVRRPGTRRAYERGPDEKGSAAGCVPNLAYVPVDPPLRIAPPL